MNKEDYLREYGIEQTSKQETQGLPIRSNSVEEMRERLELKKLQIEIDKLEKPDTSIDYYSKMLELQQQHFQQVLQMQQEQGNLKLEIEKLKLEEIGDSDDFMPLIKSLLPLLPSIIASKNQIPASNNSKSNDAGAKSGEGVKPSPPNEEEKEKGGNENMEITKETTAGELQEYIDGIRAGEITFEEALEDFKNSPYSKMMNDEQFKEKFDKIKQGITI